MSTRADPRHVAESLEQLCKVVLELSLIEMVEAQATWLAAPPAEQDLYHFYMERKRLFENSLREYLDARVDLIRWGVVR